MYNFTVGGVQFLPTALFNQLRRGCSTSNGQGVQLGRYIQYSLLKISSILSTSLHTETVTASPNSPSAIQSPFFFICSIAITV